MVNSAREDLAYAGLTANAFWRRTPTPYQADWRTASRGGV